MIRCKSIPYATCERFGYPKPINEYAKPHFSEECSPACPQEKRPIFSEMFGFDVLKDIVESENCLNLTVTRPDSDEKDLPVMVWVHGGSHMVGAGDAVIFDPTNLVKEQNVIVVNINYRLGLFGFLGGFNDIPPNLGYLDIYEAVKWVSGNIDGFGGNKHNITVFGQSAGAEAIVQLLLIEGAKDLFKNAVIQSAPLGLIYDREELTRTMQKHAKDMNRGTATEDILNLQTEVWQKAGNYGMQQGMPLGNQYGMHPFPEEDEIMKVWKENTKNINILIGYTRNETSFFLPHLPFVKNLAKYKLFGNLLKNTILRSTTNKIFKKETIRFAENAASESNNVFLYEIFWRSRLNPFGATHSIDLPLLFCNGKLWESSRITGNTDCDSLEGLQKKVRALWGKFAKAADIGDKGKIKKVLKYHRVVR